MTPKEALKWLDEHNTSGVLPLEVKVVCSKVLEKQIPKKPIGGWYACPKCGMYQNHMSAYRWCKYCGQAISWADWSEE